MRAQSAMRIPRATVGCRTCRNSRWGEGDRWQRKGESGEGFGGQKAPHLELCFDTLLAVGMMPAGGDRSNFFHQVPMRSTSPVTSLRVSEYVFPPSGPAQERR